MKRNRRAGGWRAIGLALATGLATVGAALAQDPAPAAKPATKGKARRGGLFAPPNPKKAVAKNGADPLAGPAEPGKATPEPGTYHYTFRLRVADGTPLSTAYYPSRLGTGAAVVMLVHERDRSIKDFDDRIAEFQNLGLAEGLQKEGYAVLAFDLRGHGSNTRKNLTAKDWQAMVSDLQVAYTFLIDRHNRGELNLARLGVIAVGEGANLAAIWASLPGGAVSSQGRTGDLAGLVLISPMVDAQSQGLRALQPLLALAPRMRLCVLAGERDPASAEVVKAARAAIVRIRANTVELFPTSLHGFKLLRLEPNVTPTLLKFLDEALKAKAEEWEPRYNLEPAPYSDVQMVVRTAPKGDAPKPGTDQAK